MFSLELNIAGKVYKSKGKDLAECIANLKYPPTIKAGELVVKFGKKQAKVDWYPRVLRKLSVNGIFRMIWAKRLNLLLK